MRGKKLLCMGMAVVFIYSNLPQMKMEAQAAEVGMAVTNMSVEEENEKATNDVSEGYQYTEMEDGALEITGYIGSDTELIIPAEIDGKNVTNIGGYAFLGRGSLKSVIIPNSVISLEDETFSGCSSLENVEIPDSVTTIGDRAFYSTSWLENKREENPLVIVNNIVIDGYKCIGNVSIPDGVVRIGDSAFSFGSSLTGIIISNSVNSVGKGAFLGCKNLTEVVFPESITNIEGSAFSDCSSLSKVIVPNKITDIEAFTFSGCSSLEEVTILNGVTQIGASAFRDCSSLKDITIPGSVTQIELSAFSGCSSLQNMVIPDNVVSIGAMAFSNCNSMISVTISRGVEKIGYDVFSGCSSLTGIQVSSENGEYASLDGVLYNKELTEVVKCPEGKKGEVVLPGTVTEFSTSPIGFCSHCSEHSPIEAFRNCKNLTSIVIQEGITSLPRHVFYDCTSMIKLTLPESLERIGNSDRNQGNSKEILKDCRNLTLIVMPDSFAESYAKRARIKYIYAEEKNIPCSHSWGTEVIPATSYQNGKITETCAKCGEKTITMIYAPNVISLSKTSVTYNNKTQKPSITIKDSQGNFLNSTNDYTVAYPKIMKNVGQYTVIINFKGNYSGTVKKTFRIVPQGTSLSKTMAKKKGFTVKWKKQAKQTTGYEIAYSTNSKFPKKSTKIVPVRMNKTVSKSIIKLKPNKKYYVRIRTYKTVKGKKYYSDWSKMKNITTKK